MRSLLVVIPFILSAMATGQQPRLTCHTDVGVYATNGPKLFLNFIPKSTAITKANLPYRGVQAYDFQVGLTLNPDAPLRISSYGRTCGMKLSMSGVVSGSGHTVSCKIEGGFANRGGILMLGVQPLAIPFPGTPCTILVNPAVTLPFSDANGTSMFDLYAPGRIDGVFYLQALSAHSAFGYTSFRMSNGIKVDGG